MKPIRQDGLGVACCARNEGKDVGRTAVHRGRCLLRGTTPRGQWSTCDGRIASARSSPCAPPWCCAFGSGVGSATVDVQGARHHHREHRDLAAVGDGGAPIRCRDILGNAYHKRTTLAPGKNGRVFKGGGLGPWTSGVRPFSARRLARVSPLAPTHHWFTRDGLAVIAGADPIDDKGYGDARPRALAVLPTDGSAARRIPIDSAWVFDDLIKADARTIWQPESGTVTALVTERATGERAAVRFDLTSGRSRVLWKGRARLANLTGDASHTAVVGMYQDVGTAPEVYRFPAAFTSRERVSHIDPRLERVSPHAEIFETTIPDTTAS